jgi:UPF0755 protein
MELPETNPFQYDYEPTTPKSSGLFRYVVIIGAVVAMIILLAFANNVRPPKDFKKDTLTTVYSGMTTQDLATVLKSNNIIRSEKIFRLILSMRWNAKPIMVGDYIFEKPQPSFSVAYRITHGIYGNSRIKVTFPEGISVKNMADILLKNIPEFPVVDFLSTAQSKEGYLFPDTYYFFRTMSADQIISVISAQFEKEMKVFSDDIVDGKTVKEIYGKTRTLKDVITMASILEREANGKDEAKVISGILWKRMQKNMPLQVDATFLYTIQKGSSALTQTDLRTDGPYNTYTRTGLPVGPIGNPGTVMIEAALHPVESPYWYYLHDNNGGIHYAKTYQDHLQNKRKYLD